MALALPLNDRTIGELRKETARSLHCAPPDFLLNLMALMHFMRLSVTERRTRGLVQCCVAGNPGTLRSGWPLCGREAHRRSLRAASRALLESTGGGRDGRLGKMQLFLTSSTSMQIEVPARCCVLRLPDRNSQCLCNLSLSAG